MNSLTHFFGARPFDYRIRPTENRLVIYLSLGEGNHNFHHAFAYDYTSSGAPVWESFNPSTLFIDISYLLGQAYDCKKASRAVIEGTIRRKGVPAYFDAPRGLCFRISSGIIDWFFGLTVALWPVYPILLYKYFSGQTIVIL